jgi:hypothetical protein
MRNWLAALLSLFGLVPAVAVAAPPPASQEAEMARELRAMAFGLSAADIGVTRENHAPEVWGVLMETSSDEGYFPLVVLADGSTSLYFSNGGGVIGSGDHDAVRRAGTAYLVLAEKSLPATTVTTSTAPPAPGETRFHLLTFVGMRSYAAPEIELGEGRDPLSPLFQAAHAVITAVRRADGESR